MLNNENKIVLYRVASPYYVAGIECVGDVIIRAAPIIAFSKKYTLSNFIDYCKYKGFTIERVKNE